MRTLSDMEEFVRDTRASLAVISSALTQSEHGAWVKEAAKIRENCNTMGLDRMADVCAQLEKVTDSENLRAAEIVFENLARAFADFTKRQAPSGAR